MYDLKSRDEFHKCGIIVVAPKRNKIAFSCIFCQQIFLNLQPFMRHLRLLHNAELQFDKLSEIETVYSVEELTNGAPTSFMPDLGIEHNSPGDCPKWLNDDDIKWLDEGIEPSKGQHDEDTGTDDNLDQGDIFGINNISILRALKECDVFCNVSDEVNNTEHTEAQKCGSVENAFLKNIQTDDFSQTCKTPAEEECVSDTLNRKYLLNIQSEKEPSIAHKRHLLRENSAGKENMQDIHSIKQLQILNEAKNVKGIAIKNEKTADPSVDDLNKNNVSSKYQETNLRAKLKTLNPFEIGSSQKASSLVIKRPPNLLNSAYSKKEMLASTGNDLKDHALVKAKSSLTQTQDQIFDHTKRHANKVSIDSMQSAQGNAKRQTRTTANKTPHKSNLNYRSYAIVRSCRRKKILQRMCHIKNKIFKSIEAEERKIEVNGKKSSRMKPAEKQKVFIENVQILPNIGNPLSHSFKSPFEKVVTTSLLPPRDLPDDFKLTNNMLSHSPNNLTIVDQSFIENSLKRQPAFTLRGETKKAKCRDEYTNKEKATIVERTAEDTDVTQLDLSESLVDFLQRDLIANQLNVESFLNEDLTEVESASVETTAEVESNTEDEASNIQLSNDLLDQEIRKESPKEDHAMLISSSVVKEFDNSKDIDLLAKFGLKILKFPEIEDTITIEERDEMYDRASKFSKIYKKSPKIWSTRHYESLTFKQDLAKSFQLLLIEANHSLNLYLNMTEYRRLANLINSWYTHNFRRKLIEKRKLSEATNRYLVLFNYIPKTIKTLRYCEYCAEYFNNEHKYSRHRIMHTANL